MGLAAFNRMRREQAEREAKAAEAAKVLEVEKEPELGENEGRNDVVININDMPIENVKGFLDKMEIKYAHNTSEKKLREKLKEAL